MSAGYKIGRSIAVNWTYWLFGLLGTGMFSYVVYLVYSTPPRPPVAAIAAAPVTVKPLAQTCEESGTKRLEDAKLAMQRKEPKAAFDALDGCHDYLTPQAKTVYKKSMDELAKIATEKQKKLGLSIKKQEADRLAARKREGVSIGMSQQEVVQSSWGKPRKINTTTTAYGAREQWVYNGGYLYFENGVLRTIQN